MEKDKKKIDERQKKDFKIFEEKRKRKNEDDIESFKEIKKLKLNFLKINYFNDLKINFENNKKYNLEIYFNKNLILKLKNKIFEKNNYFKQDFIGCGGNHSMIYNGLISKLKKLKNKN
jgi:hypothetical protein